MREIAEAFAFFCAVRIRPANPCAAQRGVWAAAQRSGSSSSSRLCG